MKIGIPVDNNSMQSTICQSFGRAPFFLFYETEKNSADFIKNQAEKSSGGAGVKAAQTIADNGADAVIVPRCGQNAANVLKSANIKMYKSISESIMDNINELKAGNLAELDNIHPGFHRHGV